MKYGEESELTIFEVILNYLNDRKNVKWIRELNRRKKQKEFNHEMWVLIMRAATRADYSNEWERVIYNHKNLNLEIWEKIVVVILTKEMNIQLPFLSDKEISFKIWRLIKSAIYDYDNMQSHLIELQKIFYIFFLISSHYYYMRYRKLSFFMNDNFIDFCIPDMPKINLTSMTNGNLKNIKNIIHLIRKNKYEDKRCNIYEHVNENDFIKIAMTPIYIPTEGFHCISGEHVLFMLHKEPVFNYSMLPVYNISKTDDWKDKIYHQIYEQNFGKFSYQYVNKLSSILKIPKKLFSTKKNGDTWSICDMIRYVNTFKNSNDSKWKKRGQKNIFQIITFPASFSDIYADGNTTRHTLPEKLVMPILFLTLLIQGIPQKDRMIFSGNITEISLKLLYTVSYYIPLYT